MTRIGDAAFNGNAIERINGENSDGIIYARTEQAGEDRIDNTTIVSYGGAANDINFIPEGVTTIGTSAFSLNLLERVTIPAGVTSIGNEAFENNQLKEVTIPASVTSIGDRAFENNQLDEVTIPAGVTSIGDRAFRNNRLEEVTIPASVTSIGNRAFETTDWKRSPWQGTVDCI